MPGACFGKVSQLQEAHTQLSLLTLITAVKYWWFWLCSWSPHLRSPERRPGWTGEGARWLSFRKPHRLTKVLLPDSITQASIIDRTPEFEKEKTHQIGNTNGDLFVVKPWSWEEDVFTSWAGDKEKVPSPVFLHWVPPTGPTEQPGLPGYKAQRILSS